MMSLPSSLLAFALFKTIQSSYSRSRSSPHSDTSFFSSLSEPFTDVENVFVQSLAVAVGTGPLAFGLVGVIPAIEKFLTPEEAGISPNTTTISRLFTRDPEPSNSPIKFTFIQLVCWSAALAFFGVFFAVLLRKPIIVTEKLKFPSGSATATMIAVLHQKEITNIHDNESQQPELDQNRSNSTYNRLTDEDELLDETDRDHGAIEPEDVADLENLSQRVYSENLRVLVISFCISASYSLLAFFFPVLRNIPIFGNRLAKNHLWTFQPSPAYFGQGIIMGLPTVSSMLFGAVLGWGVLGPMSQRLGWAPGPVGDWKTGAQGWILWISLAIMVADTLISFFTITGASLYKIGLFGLIKNMDTSTVFNLRNSRNQSSQQERSTNSQSRHGYQALNSTHPEDTEIQKNTHISDDQEPDALEKHIISNKFAILGLILSCVICVVALKVTFELPMNKKYSSFKFDMPIFPIVVSVLLALLLAILGVRALGETDLNPVSGIGKISQLVFAVLIPPGSHPAAVLINLIAGGVTEAGAQQAGDLMQDLKTGHLIGASPRAQFLAQMIGSLWSVFVSAAVYRLYDIVYTIPGDLFRIPTAVVWIDCSRLVTGKGLPPHAMEFSWIFGIVFAILAMIKTTSSFLKTKEEIGSHAEVEEYTDSRGTVLSSSMTGRKDLSRSEGSSEERITQNIWSSEHSSQEGLGNGPESASHNQKTTNALAQSNYHNANECSRNTASSIPYTNESPRNCATLPSSNNHPTRSKSLSSKFFDVITSVAKYSKYIPSGVAVGIGIYNTPSFTLARFCGGLFASYWMKYRVNKPSSNNDNNEYNASLKIVILSSGLVLGEGLFSVVSLIMTSLGVPHF